MSATVNRAEIPGVTDRIRPNVAIAPAGITPRWEAKGPDGTVRVRYRATRPAHAEFWHEPTQTLCIVAYASAGYYDASTNLIHEHVDRVEIAVGSSDVSRGGRIVARELAACAHQWVVTATRKRPLVRRCDHCGMVKRRKQA